jgi:rhodanese-related sulfurtransferase
MIWLVLLLLATVGLSVAAFAFDPERDAMDGMKTLVRERFPEVQQLQPAELADWLADTNRVQPVLLDVRTKTEFAVSHLPGARQVEPKAAVADLVATLPTNQPVVVYCSVGYRSSELAVRLRRAGVTNVLNLEGSIFQWANEGRPVERDGQLVREVHPYNETFGRLLKAELRPAKLEKAE